MFAAEHLNQICFCITLDQTELTRALDTVSGEHGFQPDHSQSATLFSNLPVFLSNSALLAMWGVVAWNTAGLISVAASTLEDA